MRLLIRSSEAARACDWTDYALLRDNVQHFLEKGGVTDRFAALHGIERAVDEGAALVPAAKLRGEVLRAWCSLWQVQLTDAAISLRTRALMTGALGSSVRGTLVARQAGWPLPVGLEAGRVPEAAWHFVEGVLSLTDTAVDGDVLEVRRVRDEAAESKAVAGGARS